MEFERAVLAKEAREAKVDEHDPILIRVRARLPDPLDEVAQTILNHLLADHLAKQIGRDARDLLHVEVDRLLVGNVHLRPPVVQLERACERLVEDEHRVEELHVADRVLAVAELTHAQHADANLILELLGGPAQEGLPDVRDQPHVACRQIGLVHDQLEQLRAQKRRP